MRVGNLPLAPETRSEVAVSPSRIDVVPPTHTTPLSTYDYQRLNYLVDDFADIDSECLRTMKSEQLALVDAYNRALENR